MSCKLLSVAFFFLLATAGFSNPVPEDALVWEDVGATGPDQYIRELDVAEDGVVYVLEDSAFQSFDNGETWLPLDLPSGFVQDLFCVRENLWLITASEVYVSTNQGDSFDRLDTTIPKSDRYIKRAFTDHKNSIVLVCYRNTPEVEGFHIYHSLDRGESWEVDAITFPDLDPNDIQDLAIYPDRGLLLLSTWGEGVWRSLDFGRSWERVFSEAAYVYTAVMPFSKILVGTLGGVYVSSDRGVTWSRPTDHDLNRSKIIEFAVDGRGILYAGSYGCSGPGEGVFVSLDGGESWGLCVEGLSRRSLKYVRVSPAGYLFAGIGYGAPASREGVFRTPLPALQTVGDQNGNGVPDVWEGAHEIAHTGAGDRYTFAHLGTVEFPLDPGMPPKVWSHSLQSTFRMGSDGSLRSAEYGEALLDGNPGWMWSSTFGWTHFGADAAQYDGWVHSERFGWMKFVYPGDDISQTPYLYAPRINSWMSVNYADGGSFTSFQWGVLTPDSGDMTRYQSSIFGGLTTGDFDGWVASDRFGWMWANGDGTWFWSETRKEWLGVTPEGGIWSTEEGRFL